LEDFRKRFGNLVIAILALICSTATLAETNRSAPEVDKEAQRNYVASHPVDSFEPFSGNMKLSYQDLVLPGNGGLDITVNRIYDLGALSLDVDLQTARFISTKNSLDRRSFIASANWVGLGIGWSLNLAPKVVFSPGYGPDSPVNGTVEDGDDTLCQKRWTYAEVQYTLQLPNGQSEVFFVGDTFDYALTKTNWKLTCDGPNGMHRLYSPDGTMYELGSNTYLYPYTHTQSRVFQTTRIVDKNANWISIGYAPFGAHDASYGVNEPRHTYLPIKVNASDGRTISLIYDPGSLASTSYNTGSPAKLMRIEASNGQVWQYTQVTTSTPYTLLSEVIRPDQTSWKYSYWDDVASAANGSHGVPFSNQEASSFRLKSVVFPTGGSLNYEYEVSKMYNIFGDPAFCDDPDLTMHAQPTAYQTVRLKRKTSSDGGIWQYSYAPGLSEGQYDITTIDAPSGQQIYKHMGFGYFTPASYAANDPITHWCGGPGVTGAWRYGLLVEHSKGTNYQEVYRWNSRYINSRVNFIRGRLIYMRDQYTYFPDLESKTITMDGATYTTSYSARDIYGNPGSITESGPNGGNRTTSYTYHIDPAKWILHQVKDETFPGSAITRSFDGNANMLSITQDGVTTSHTYDSQGNIATTTFPRNLVHTYSNYKRGIPQNESQPEGISISRAVDDAGNITSETNGENRTTTYSFDGLNRLTGIVYPKGSPTIISYTANSKKTTRSPLVENVTYDGFGHAINVSLGGIARTYQYDPLGRKIFASNPDSALGAAYRYDILNRPIKITNADSTFQNISYAAGSMTVMDERQQATTSTFRSYGDPNQRFLMSVSAPEPSANISLARNARDLVTDVTQDGLTRLYGYNSNYYISSATNPETGTTVYGRDAAGNLTSKTVGASGTTSYGYDGLNRLSSITYPGNSSAVTKTYSKTSKLKSLNSAVAARAYVYDDNDNLTSEVLTVDGMTLTAGYGYNGNDQLSSITYPRSNRIVDYAPDALGRPTQASGYISNVSYWPSRQIKQIGYGNGTVSSYGQNSRLWPSSFTTQKNATAYVNNSYSYDGMGNLMGIIDSVDSSYNRSMGYDNINRLTSISGLWGSGSIGYSGSGNITQQTFGSSLLSYSYDARNRLASVSGTRSTSFTYDAYGNVVSGDDNTFAYDDAPNLRCFNCSNPTSKIDYQYDGSNMRVVTDKAGIKTYEFHAANGNLLQEFTPGSSKRHVDYIYLNGKRIAQHASENMDGTATALTITGDPIAIGSPVTLIATVTGANLTGNVLFFDGTTMLGSLPLTNGQATLDVVFNSPGTRNLNARYAGDNTNWSSTSAVLSRTVKFATSTSVTASPNPAIIGHMVTVNAAVSGPGSPTGTVVFKNAGSFFGSATLVNNAATLSSSALPIGYHTFTAEYSGDNANFASASSVFNQIVNDKTVSITRFTGLPSSVQINKVLNGLRVQVEGTNPSGVVTLKNSAGVLGTAQAVYDGASGRSYASFPGISFSVLGTHTLTAEYPGDASNKPSTITQTVTVTTYDINALLVPILMLLED